MTQVLARPTIAPSHRPDAATGVGLVAPEGALRRELMSSGGMQWLVINGDPATAEPGRHVLGASPVETLVYIARLERPPDTGPDLRDARATFTAFRDAGLEHAVIVSSTAAYGATPHHAGLATERRTPAPVGQPISRAWLELESLAADAFGELALTVLRAAPTLAGGEHDYYSRLLGARSALTVMGHDPTLQFLGVCDLADAIRRAVRQRPCGIFNVVPAAPVPLRAALREAGCRRVPVPWLLQRPVRSLLARVGGVASPDQLQFVRYHLTASGDKSARELGFIARDTSASAVRAFRRSSRGSARHVDAESTLARFDPFGLDPSYIDACGRGFMGFLHRRYWRVETHGLDCIPREGAGVLVGLHRGFMPFDGVMTLLSVVKETGRIPRFLIHPGVGLRFPFLFNLMSKLGGVIACQENADHVLQSGELLGVYPEGIRGAFTMYRRAHQIGPSWRNDCVTFALRHRVPIVPFVTVGSAEIFPILGRVNWGWWKKYSEWPFIPITPTFPLLPLPLPSKWHTLFLEPMHVEREHSPTDAEHPAVIRAIGAELKRRMEAAVSDLVSRRKSIFFGSLFARNPQ